MNFWSLYENNDFLEYIQEKITQKLLINFDYENKLSLIKNEEDSDKINISKVYSLTFPYIDDMINPLMFLDIGNISDYNLHDIESLRLDLMNKQLLNSQIIKNIILLIEKKQFWNIKCLDIIISNSFSSYGKDILNNLPTSLNYLKIEFIEIERYRPYKINNFNNKLNSLVIYYDIYNKMLYSSREEFMKTYNSYFLNSFNKYFPNSLKYIEFQCEDHIGDIKKDKKKFQFPNKIEIIIMYKIYLKKNKTKFPFSTKILICNQDLKNNLRGLNNITKVVLYKQKIKKVR